MLWPGHSEGRRVYDRRVLPDPSKAPATLLTFIRPSLLHRHRRHRSTVLVESWIRSYPQLLGFLRAVDKAISPLPGFRVIGDHMLLRFERVQA